jgi:hypothetical protein
MTDDEILYKISAEMKRLILTGCSPDEHVYIPPTLEDGRAAFAILDHIFGEPGEADTERAIGVECLHFYICIFEETTKAFGIDMEDLRKLWERTPNKIDWRARAVEEFKRRREESQDSTVN